MSVRPSAAFSPSEHHRRRCLAPRHAAAPRPQLDTESRSWWERLHAAEPVRGQAVAELHERLCREAAFHVRLRVRDLSEFPRSDIEDVATQAAGDALMALLGKLEDYRGDSRFWTWARRFAALEAPVSIRRRVGHDRVGISRDPDCVRDVLDPGRSVHERAELHELVRAVTDLIVDALTVRQRAAVVAIAIDGLPAQAFADRHRTTPGAIYKTLYDARRKLHSEVTR